jgi:DNA mismatch repair protein MutS
MKIFASIVVCYFSSSCLVFKPLMQTETKARFITDELVNKSFLLRSINERVIERELILLDELRSPILEATELIRKACEEIAQLDLNSALAVLAQQYSYTKPKIISSSQPVLKIVAGRHPVLDRKFFDAQPPQHFTPNTLHLSEKSRSRSLVCLFFYNVNAF